MFRFEFKSYTRAFRFIYKIMTRLLSFTRKKTDKIIEVKECPLSFHSIRCIAFMRNDKIIFLVKKF